MSAAPAPNPREIDVAIVGGGMVGASLAVALAGTGVRVLLIESVPFGTSAVQPSFDERTTRARQRQPPHLRAHSGVWERDRRRGRRHPLDSRLRCRPVRRSRASRPHEQGIEAFGYVVANRAARRGAVAAAHAPHPELTLRVPASLTQLQIDSAGAALDRRRRRGGT